MSEINSPLGRMKLAQQPHQAQRVLTVPDESGFEPEPQQFQATSHSYSTQEINPQFMSEEEREHIAQMRREQRAAASKISPIARERIEILTGLNRLRTEIQIEGVTFALRSLKSSEMRDIMIAGTKANSNQERYLILRDNTLACALYAIDGQDIRMVLGTADKAAMFELLNSMEHSVVEKIFDHYEGMLRKNIAKMNIADKEDGRQVGEDIKKS